MLGLVAQAGDLAESALKRRFGVEGSGARSSRATAASWIASMAWWRRHRRSGLIGLAINVHPPARALLLGS